MQPKKTSSTKNYKVAGDWGRQSTFLLRLFPELTDEDLEFEEGKEDELIQRIEKRLQMDQKEVIGYLNKGQLATL